MLLQLVIACHSVQNQAPGAGEYKTSLALSKVSAQAEPVREHEARRAILDQFIGARVSGGNDWEATCHRFQACCRQALILGGQAKHHLRVARRNPDQSAIRVIRHCRRGMGHLKPHDVRFFG
jgi:hypothetical protein